MDILKSWKSTSRWECGQQLNAATSPVDVSEARNIDVAKNYTGDVCTPRLSVRPPQ